MPKLFATRPAYAAYCQFLAEHAGALATADGLTGGEQAEFERLSLAVVTEDAHLRGA